ncbi:MAG TPA: adenine deaminase [Bacteroidales bacterium]|jgi:adenine deaminase|nr:adenine deaminase [Bacteroidales bacterium]HOL97352.1 adenine deaminase [Bacteroidales bacterium]HOM36083.1 adenine deaminase [Bacteroidales bacterium]HPD22918.1 adenine deaminase [Bacteroidales bacterium]HRS98586.1 adenine deaminase [Bacteroidales bacterium]
MKKITGKLVDLFSRKIFNAELFIENGRISNIKKVNTEFENFIVPGLVDSHVHIESSMLIPYQFAKLAVQNGTVAIVADPHEIANVLGKKGVEFMINNSKETPLKTFFGIPSCVPATLFETSGAVLDHNDIDELLTKQEVKILGEMMNFPGVINEDETVIKKLNVAKKHNAQIDGHIPGISGDNLKKYIDSGISTDHECFTIEEASEKIKLGMKILIREGSAAKNFDELYPLISKHNKMVMLCTDDSHPDDLINYGHINKIIKKGIKYGLDIFDLLSAACINPVEHYNLPVGLLRVNDPADFIIVDDLNNFNILETYIDGEIVYSNNRVFFNNSSSKPVNNFNANKISVEDLKVKPKSNKIKVIEIIDKELITNSFIIKPKVVSNNIISDIEKDILKIVVYNRYQKNSKPSIGFIHGIGLKSGAIATTVAHDSHNIIATGCSDEEIAAAINEIVEKQGGLTFVHGKDYYTLELEYAGLMTNKDPMIVADLYEKMNKVIKQNGSKLTAPYMTISFMALLVIPHLKIGDKGLFDVDRFEFTQLFV